MSAPQPVERGFTGVYIPAPLYTNYDLSWIEKIFLIEVQALNALPRGCFARNQHFAAHLGVSVSRVSEILSKFEALGYVAIVYDRNEGSKLLRKINITHAGRALFWDEDDLPVAKSLPNGEPSENRSLRETDDVPSENRRLNNIKDNNISLTGACEREALVAEHAALGLELMGLAGEGLADPAQCSNIAIVLPMTYLLQDRPDAPACTVEELKAAATWAGDYMLKRHGPRTMIRWDMAVRKALELRDARINGVPVKEAARPKPSGVDLGEAKAWTPERWGVVVGLAVRKGWAWKPEWGPEPGQAGSMVPPELVGAWSNARRSL